MTAAARYRGVLYLLLAPYLVGVGVLVVVHIARAAVVVTVVGFLAEWLSSE